MKYKVIIFLLFGFHAFSQQIRVSHELNNMAVARNLTQKNDVYPTRPVYWHFGYVLNFETPIVHIEEKELTIGVGFGAGVMPIALLANVFLPILGSDEKVSVLSLNHLLILNYAKTDKFILRGGYQGVYFDASDYDFIDKYNYGFLIGGKFNVGGRTFFGLDFNAQRFRHKYSINNSSIIRTDFLYGFTFRAQKYFKN